MKTYKLLTGLIVILMLTASCKDYLDINKDPDAPTSEQMTEAVYLPGTLGFASYTGVEYSNYYQSFWMLQGAYLGSAAGGAEHFVLHPADFDDEWTIYYKSIKNATLLRDLAAKNENFWYEGIANVILAHQYSILTDMFGDIPYSQTIQYPAISQPKFDSQEDIYKDLLATLDVAIAKLSTARGTQKKPGGDDLLFNGKISSWIKFAHSLKARLYLRTYYRDNSNAQKVLDEIALGITTAGDNALFKYGEGANDASFWYQYSQNWTTGTLHPSKYFVDLMNTLNDPRREKLFTLGMDEDSVDVYRGIISGVNLGEDRFEPNADDEMFLSGFSDAISGPSVPAEFSSNVEMAFIKAEATLLNGGAVGDVQTVLNEAITASMNSLGVSLGETTIYLAKDEVNLSLVTGIEAMQKIIITQKYLASFHKNGEVYNDWRRTGYPTFTQTDWANSMDFGGGVHETAPVRHMYPSYAIQRNENTPILGDAENWTKKVWWDNKDKSGLVK